MSLRRISTFFLILALGATMAWAGGQQEAGQEEQTMTDDGPSLSTMEAPMLTEMVNAGELPPLEERLPSEPAVVEPLESLGRYGGSWRTMYRGPGDWPWFTRTIGTDTLVNWNLAWDELQPGIARDWEVQDAGATYVFHLREGMKWNDGEPFTSDDFVWWYENVVTNDEIAIPYPSFFRTDGELFDLDAPDEYTVVFSFSQPNALFLDAAASADGRYLIPHAEHYFKQFHGDENPDADAIAQDAGYSGWVEYYEFLGDQWWDNPDRPSLYAWTPETGVGEGTEQWVVTRNPYYWKTDSEGRQLPYLDRVVFYSVPDSEVRLLRITAGEIDLQSRGVSNNDRSVYEENKERGDYRFLTLEKSDTNTDGIAFNQTVEDPVLREIFRQKDFRVAMSLAINRQEINDLFFFGATEPHQIGPRPSMAFYNERLGTQYTEYDPERANQLLDDLGYTRNDDGVRVGPDGNEISVTLTAHQAQDRLEIVKQGWEAVGIQTNLNIIERSLMTERYLNNQHEVGRYYSNPGLNDWFLDSRHTIPTHWESIFAVPWANWYSGNSGPTQEPPADVKEMQTILEDALAEPDLQERYETIQPALEIAADRFDVIGLVLQTPSFGIVRNDFHNVPERMFNTGGSYNDPGPARPEQFWTSRELN